MSKAVSRGQALQVSARVATQVNWDELDGDMIQNELINLTPEEFGRRFTMFLKNGGRVIIGEPRIIPIDRSKPFNPAAFIGVGWTIEEEDERSLALPELDLTAVRFEHMLKNCETHVKGETKIERLKVAGHTRLDAKILQTLWENKHLISERWKEETNGNTTFIFFDGTILRDPNGHRVILYLSWYGSEWHWHGSWLDNEWLANFPSAVLAD